MRTGVILSAGVAVLTVGAADAQTRVVQHGPGASYGPPARIVVQRQHRPIAVPMRQSRWGSKIGGQWWGGHNAPGGWAAYRRPYRGYRLPTYWVAPRFYVTDWRLYGLTAPSGGHSWARYYDDAVLIDRDGAVIDHRSGLDWDREDYARDGRGSSGVGGAIAGAVVGGVAGNVIAGRGDRLAGTLVGTGVGAAAGLAIDRAHDRDRRERRETYREERYEQRGEPLMAPDRAPPPPPGYQGDHHSGHHDGSMVLNDDRGSRSGSTWRSADGRTTVITQGGAHIAGDGYAGAGVPVIVAPAGAVTTVTIASAPVITTTTTTEYYEDAVTYSRPAVAKRKVYTTKRVWRAKAKPRCICR